MHSQNESWLASSWTHDIRTHLNILQGALRLMSSGQLTQEQSHEYVAIAQKNVFAILRLINKLLDMDGGKEVGEAKIAEEQINVLLTSLVDNVRPYAHERQINLEYSIQKSLYAYCDPEMLERILYNLLSNAIKYTPSLGSVFLLAFCKDDLIQIVVSDTGIGLTEEQKEQFRSEPSVPVSGGLGLQIVKRLTAIMHGSVEYIENKGEMNMFLLKLPMRAVS